MCGRFTYKLTWAEIVKLYRLTLDAPARNTQARYNICPTTPVDVIVSGDGHLSCIPMRWGLIPAWWNKPLKEMKLATFNARADTIATRPMFRLAFKRSRFVRVTVPALVKLTLPTVELTPMVPPVIVPKLVLDSRSDQAPVAAVNTPRSVLPSPS